MSPIGPIGPPGASPEGQALCGRSLEPGKTMEEKDRMDDQRR